MLLKNIDYMLYYNSSERRGIRAVAGAAGFKFEKPDGKPVKMPSEAVFGRHFYGFRASAED